MTVWKETRFPGYRVSDDGEVRGPSGRTLRPGKVGRFREYRHVHVYGVGMKRVHILVAHAFLGPQPEGTEVAHVNGIGHDNRAVNLAYKTKAENEADKILHGTDVRIGAPGATNSHAVLTDELVREIRSLPTPLNVTHAARRYGVSRRTINQIINGQTWRHLL